MRVYKCNRCGKYVAIETKYFFVRKPTPLWRFGRKIHICDDPSLAQLLHYLQFQEVATRNFQAYMNEMEAWCKNISKTVESRIREAEKEG